MKEEKIFDAREKNDEEILEIYKEIAKETMIADEIFKKTNNLEKSMEVYKKQFPQEEEEKQC